jgi:Zn-dependent peptidase ImmA (M78 family)/transcriptional regulator with XRE-family HTH domain
MSRAKATYKHSGLRGMNRFNHHMLTLAREARGLTQAELAARIEVVQGTLSKYENGVNEPPDEFVRQIAGALRYPPDFFFQQEQAYGFPPFHYRKRKKLSAKALGRIVAEMNIRRIHVRKLAQSFEIKTNRFIPEIDRDEYQGTSKRRPEIEDIARSLRESWMVPRGPIVNMLDLIEENGGIVIPCDFETDLLDAMSQRIDGMPVLFFVNTNAPADRVRYTLAHEIGHMVLHTITFKDDDEMEQEADHFAGAFLLPAEEIKVQLRQFDLRHLANMKGYWKVSMQAIAYRANLLRLITPYQYKMFFMEMSRLGYRKREPNEPAKEIPRLLRQMVEYHRKHLGYSISDLSNLLCLLPAELSAMYGASIFEPQARPHLRIV